MKQLIFLIIKFLSFLIIPFIKLLKVKIALINSTRFGEMIFDYFLLKNEISMKKNYNYLIFYHPQISNLYLLKLIQNNIKIFPANKIILILISNLIKISKNIFSDVMFPGDIRKHKYYSMVSETNNINNLLEREFNKDYKIKSIENLKKNIHEYIAFHSRDADYLKSFDKSKNYDYHNYRNFDFEVFEKTLLFYSKKKINTCRVGISNKSYQQSKFIKNFIYFNNFKFSNKENFISYFFSKAYLGSDSGAFTIIYLQNKPIFFVNFSFHNLYLTTFYNNCSLILNKLTDNEGIIINFQKIYELFLKDNNFYSNLNQFKTNLVLNTDNEIYSYAYEIYNNKFTINFINEHHKKLNNIFWNNFKNTFKNQHFGKNEPIIGYEYLKNNLEYFIN